MSWKQSFDAAKKSGWLAKIFFKIGGMTKRPLTNKPSAPPAESNSAAQLNAATLMKVAEVMQVLCSTNAPVGFPMPAPPVSNGPLVAASAAEIVDAMLQRLYRRMPKAGTKDSPAEHCPFSGINRSGLYELLKLRNEDGSPVIRTVSFREEGEKHGARYYSVGSVLDHLDQLAAEQARGDQKMEENGEHP
ncbi:MAG TPA: hypothetical protein VGZ93_11935 [Candidatus Methylacidiphilales bacterium]|nr:hypothetical protein [Candidatus Methylacidiphilales bacterium]